MERSVVLFVLHMPPPVHGAAMMGKYIHDSELINDAFECHYINLATAKSLEDIGNLGIAKIWQIIKLLYDVYKAVRRYKPSLVYVTPTSKGGPFLKDFLIVKLLKYLKCKVLLHYHNKGVSTFMEKPLFNLLYRSFFKNVKVILLANALYSDIKRYVSLDNVYICPNGIPNVPYEVSCDAVERTPHILFLSNLLVNKGVLILLEACAYLKEKNIFFVCDVIGAETADFNRKSFEEEIQKMELSDRVVYHGKKYGLEKISILNQSQVFVLPTLDECFPLVLLEAMQQKVTCVATDEGGIRDIIDDGVTGFVIEKNNSRILAEKLELLLLDKKVCNAMGIAGYQKYLRLFTLDKFERNMVDILWKCAKSK